MGNFYGQYIGFGSSIPSGAPSGVWIGDRGIIGGGHYGFLDVIEYTTITSTGNGTDFGDLIDGRYGLSACAGGATASTRGIFMGGYAPTILDLLDYITIASTGNAIDFSADLTAARYYGHACSNGIRGLNGGGYGTAPVYDTIDYVTMATTGACTDFGNLDIAHYMVSACADATKAIFAGGYPAPITNVIQYVTIASVGNAVDFGDLLESRIGASGASNTTRGLFYAGSAPGDTIQYITMATPGNATDFGNLAAAIEGGGAYANATRSIYSGGHPPVYSNLIQYITIASTGNASTFGNMLSGKGATLGGCSGT